MYCALCVLQLFVIGCDVINFEINLSFLIKQFFHISKKSGQKCKYLKNEKSFSMKQKAFFIVLEVLSVVRNCLKPKNVRLIFKWDLDQSVCNLLLILDFCLCCRGFAKLNQSNNKTSDRNKRKRISTNKSSKEITGMMLTHFA